MELVQRVTGHRTASVVLKHYFRPGREDFRTVITQAMPKMLGLGDPKPTAKEEMKRILKRSTNMTWNAGSKAAPGIDRGVVVKSLNGHAGSEDWKVSRLELTAPACLALLRVKVCVLGQSEETT